MTSRPSPSGLYRLGQVLRILSVVALVLVLLYLASLGVSAAEAGVGLGRSVGAVHTSEAASLAGTTVLVTIGFPLPNDGFYSIDGLTVSAQFANASLQPGPVATATGGPVSIPGRDTTNFTLLTAFDMDEPAGEVLLVQDSVVEAVVWLNATYASEYPLGVHAVFNYSWGAPFDGLAYAAGTPVEEPNGTLAVPFTVTFANHTPGLVLDGTLDAVVTRAGEGPCARAPFPLNAPDGPVTLSGTIYLPASCPAAGDTISSVFVSPEATVPLPSETIP